MPYRILLTCGSQDTGIARAVRAAIVDAFPNDIAVFLPDDDIIGGENWKSVISAEISRSDALICVVTRDSYQQPWLYVEWGAFWLTGRPYYVLLADDLEEGELFGPMLDRQATRLSEESQVRRLFAFLNEASSDDAVPFAQVPVLMETVRSALEEKARSQVALYAGAMALLPASDREKERIAEYFMVQGERDSFKRVCRELRTDEIRVRLAHKLVEQRNAEMLNIVAEEIADTGRLQEIARRMIDADMTDTPQFHTLANIILGRNQAEYRKVLMHLIERGEEEMPLFRRLVESMSNMAEVRKIGEHLIRNRRGLHQSLPQIVDLLSRFNRAELRKLVLELVLNDLQREPVFGDAIRKLAANQRQLEGALLALRDHDPNTFARILDSGIVTDQTVRARLDDLP